MLKKVLLICPSNLCYMPYVQQYVSVFMSCGSEYEIVYWDRFNLNEDTGGLRYADGKIGHSRTFFDYFYFANFVKKCVRRNKYDGVVVFGVQLAFFLSRFLVRNFFGRYIWDVRDHHFILRYFDVGRFIGSSAFVVVSSPGFFSWLPAVSNRIVSHNISGTNFFISSNNGPLIGPPYTVSCIGALRDFELHATFASTVANLPWINLEFNGRGAANVPLVDFFRSHGIHNAVVTDHYDPAEEAAIYQRATMINALIPNAGVNNVSLLPNRLYRAVISGRPVLALSGTLTGEFVSKYGLGLVLADLRRCDQKIFDYLVSFDHSQFEINSANFLRDVHADNVSFEHNLIDFLELT